MVDMPYIASEQDSQLKKLGLNFGFAGKTDFVPKVLLTKQIHSKKIVQADSLGFGVIEADGIFTQAKGVAIGVKTADCLPIIIVNKDLDFLLAVHAGWRGLCQGIVAEGVAIYQGLGLSSPLMAIIGPAICAACYEVGPDVALALEGQDLGLSKDQAKACLQQRPEALEKWFADLKKAAFFQLLNLGFKLQDIEVLHACSYEDASRWFSYRRDRVVSPSTSIISWASL